MCVFLAHQFGQDLRVENHVGSVSPGQMVRACTLFGFGLSTRPAAAARVRNDLLVHHDAGPGFPTLTLDIWQLPTPFVDRLGNPIELYHVTQVDMPNLVPGPPPPVPPLPNAAPVQALVGFAAPRLTANYFASALRAVPAAFAGSLQEFTPFRAFTPEALNYRARRGLPPPQAAPAPFVPLPVVHLTAHTARYTPVVKTATALASDLRDNPALWLVRDSDSSLASSHKAACTYGTPREVEVTCLFGIPGCGKTTYARNLFTNGTLPSTDATWAFPSALVGSDTLNNTANVWPLGPDSRSGQYSEGMEVFRKSTLSTLVLDDFSRFPPGTLDLLIMTNPDLERVILTGDPSQAHTAFPREDAQTRALPTFGQAMTAAFPLAPYATVGHRTAPRIAELFGVTTTSVREGDFLFTAHPPPTLPLLVVSPRFAETKTMGGAPAYVTGRSQGLDLQGDCCLDLGGMSNTMLDGPAVVGLTRCDGNVFLAFDHSSLPPASGIWGASTLLSILIGLSADSGCALVDITQDPDRLFARAFAEHVRASVPSMRAQAPPEALVGFAPDGVPSLTTDPGAPDLVTRGLSFHYPTFGPLARDHSSPSEHLPCPPPTGPTDPSLFLSDEEFPDSLSRQFSINGMLSHQHPPHKHPGARHHRRGDLATEQASLAKRTKRVSYEQNRASFTTRDTASRFASLKQGFTAVFPRFRTARDMSARLDLCAERVLDSWVRKRTLREIQRSMTHETVDWDVATARVFLKSQVVRKSDKWFSGAGPGQTITEFPMQQTFRDAVYALMIEQTVLEECPEHVYLHLRRSTEDLQTWVSEHMAGAEQFTETDYTAWDSSIDAPFFRFDAWLMEQLGVPQWYIDLYLEEACRTKFFRGNMGLSQKSGNRYTFLFNSLRNLALTNHTYAGLTHVPQAYGGDDSLLLGHRRPASRFDPQRWPMSPRVVLSTQGHLFGHLVTPVGLTYDYPYMHHRLVTAIAERPRDRDFFFSFHEQMAALPAPDDPAYATCYDMLVAHCHAARLAFPGLPPRHPTRPPIPDICFRNGVMQEFFPTTWGG